MAWVGGYILDDAAKIPVKLAALRSDNSYYQHTVIKMLYLKNG